MRSVSDEVACGLSKLRNIRLPGTEREEELAKEERGRKATGKGESSAPRKQECAGLGLLTRTRTREEQDLAGTGHEQGGCDSFPGVGEANQRPEAKTVE